MPRSSWNSNSPDVVGVEFLGIGVASHIVQFETNLRAVRFVAQRTGPVGQIAVYCGPGTNNPVQTQPHFTGHRTPFIVDLYPISGFDASPVIAHVYPGTLSAWLNVIDSDGSAPDGDELQFTYDSKFLFPSGSGIAYMTVQMPDAATFPLDRHVYSIYVSLSTYAPLKVVRIDQGGTVLWSRQLNNSGWYMSEVRIEAGTSGPYTAWTPSEIRQFASSIGNRRLQFEGVPGQTNVFDQLGMTVYSISEKRAGTAIVEPPGSWQWTTANLVQPNTLLPAPVTAGVEYVLLFRPTGGSADFGTTSTWDIGGLKDRRSGSTLVHFSDLNWDTYTVVQAPGTTMQTSLGDLVDGLVPVRLIDANTQTADTQPYEVALGVIPWWDSIMISRVKQRLAIPAGTTEYSAVRANVALWDDPKVVTKAHLNVQITDTVGGVIAGPFQLTPEMYEASPLVGTTTAGTDPQVQPYRTVTVPFGSGVDITAPEVFVEFLLDDSFPGEGGGAVVPWRIGALVSSISPVTGSDQTALVSGNGYGYIPPTFSFVNIHKPGVTRGDLMVSLLSQAPEITGTGVVTLQQPVTGGPCDPCDTGIVNPCSATDIPYNQVCWSPTTLTQDKFGYYEVQRRESAFSDEWMTIAIIAPTGTPVTGVPATGVPHCFDDWTHAYDSEVCYRVRQQRTDGTLSDFVEMVCVTVASPDDATMIITAQEDPSLNVALTEVFSERLPIEREWTNLDVEQTILRPIYGRDGHLAFRSSERLGLRWERRLLVSAVCTPQIPSLNVVQPLRDVTTSPVSYLVVRDREGNRWYANVAVPTITQLSDPEFGDHWLVDVEVTELATPEITAEVATTAVVGEHPT